MYQTLKSVFDHISKHLELHQKYSATSHIFNSLLGVWKCGQTLSFVFDISHIKFAVIVPVLLNKNNQMHSNHRVKLIC